MKVIARATFEGSSAPSKSLLEDRNLLKLRNLDSSCPYFPIKEFEHLGTMNSWAGQEPPLDAHHPWMPRNS